MRRGSDKLAKRRINFFENQKSLLIPLSAPSIGRGEKNNIQKALKRHELTQGNFIQEFEELIQEKTGANESIVVNSGTSGLHLAMRALGVDEKTVVIMPSVTFAATAYAAKYLGAQCLFVDIDKNSFCINLEQLAQALEMYPDKKKLVVAVDLYGIPNNYEKISSLAKKHSSSFIIDAAESLGSRYYLGPATEFADAVVYSFNGNKIVTSSGGGAIATNNHEIADKGRLWRNQSREPVEWYEHKEIGFNYRMSNLQAAVGVAQISKLEKFVSERRQIRDRYSKYLESSPVSIVEMDFDWGLSNAWLSIATFDSKIPNLNFTSLLANARKLGIELRNIWKPLHLQPVFEREPRLKCLEAEKLFYGSFCLPSSSHMSKNDQMRVISFVKEFFK